ncbi:MAG: head GIN domain-containing protein [Salibacteraceae bacterium]
MSILALPGLLWLSGCSVDINLDDCVTGDGSTITEARNLNAFFAGSSFGDFDIILRHSTNNDYRVELSGEKNILDEIVTLVERNTLLVRFAEANCFQFSEDITITIFYPPGELEAVNLGGSGSMRGDSLTGDFINLYLTGSGEIDFPVVANRMKTTISGSGSIDLKGNVNAGNFRIDGSGEINGLSMICKEANVDIFGSGNAYLFVENQLNAEVGGSGSVFYLGNPTVDSNVSGSGKVTRY